MKARPRGGFLVYNPHMSNPDKARVRATASYQRKFREVDEYLEELAVLIKQDKTLLDADTAYRVKKCIQKIEESRKILTRAAGTLTGAKMEPDAGHVLVMPGQRDLL